MFYVAKNSMPLIIFFSRKSKEVEIFCCFNIFSRFYNFIYSIIVYPVQKKNVRVAFMASLGLVLRLVQY